MQRAAYCAAVHHGYNVEPHGREPQRGCRSRDFISGKGAAHRHEGRVEGHALAAAAERPVLRGQRAPERRDAATLLMLHKFLLTGSQAVRQLCHDASVGLFVGSSETSRGRSDGLWRRRFLLQRRRWLFLGRRRWWLAGRRGCGDHLEEASARIADVARPELRSLQRTYQQIVPCEKRGQDWCEHISHQCGGKAMC